MADALSVEERVRILVIEDDAGYAEFVVDTLRGDGHHVMAASTAAAAREHAATLQPDAVILDLRLPDADGYELARQLRRDLLPETSIIIVLTADLFPERERLEVFGIDMVLSKPVEPALVRGIVDVVRSHRRRKLLQPHP